MNLNIFEKTEKNSFIGGRISEKPDIQSIPELIFVLHNQVYMTTVYWVSQNLPQICTASALVYRKSVLHLP